MKNIDPFESFLLNLADAERRLLEELHRIHLKEISQFEKFLIWRKKKRFIEVLRWLQQHNKEKKEKAQKVEKREGGHRNSQHSQNS